MLIMFYLKKYFLSFLLILSEGSLFINVIKMRQFNSLKYLDPSAVLVSKVTDNLSEVFQLFNSSTLLCIVAEHNETIDIFLNSCHRNGIPLILYYFTRELNVCDSIVFLEMNNFTDCYKLNFNSNKSSYYFLNFHSNMNFVELEKLFFNSLSPEVVAYNGFITFELSTVFLVPRHFISSSIPKVLNHRREGNGFNLRGSQLVLATMHFPPFLMFPDINKSEPDDGVEYLLVKELSERLNFTIQYDVYKYWGLLMPNGTWYGEGLAQAMQEGKADLAVANIWQIPSFYRILDFGPSLNRNSFAFLVGRPKTIDFQWQVFMTMFKPLVWIFTAIAFVVVVIKYQFIMERDLYPGKQSWAASVLTIFGIFLMTTSADTSRASSSRPLLLAWSVFSLLLTTLLSTGIVSRLSISQYTPRVDTHQHLVQGGFYIANHNYRRFKTLEIRNVVFDFDNPWSREFEQRYVYVGEEDIAQLVKKDKKVTIPVQTYGDDFFIINSIGLGDKNEFHDLRRTKQVTQGCHLSWGVKKHSPLLRPLTVVTHRFIQAGLTKQWQNQVIGRWPRYAVNQLLIERDIPSFREPQPMKLNKIIPIFYILAIGLAIASLVFFLEIYW